MMFLSLLACVDEETHPAEGRAGSGSPPEVVWHAGLGTEFEEHVHEGHQTTDGGSIAIGHAQESSGNTTDMLVVKASASGDQEWLARLLTEPRRLWKRYLVGNPLFLARVLRERVRR